MFVMQYDSPLGRLHLASDGEAVTGLWFQGQRYFPRLPENADAPDLPVFQAAWAWLDAYFSHAPLPSLPPLAPDGTAFQRAVWAQIQTVPYGETTTYGTLAERLGAFPRAVGGAVGRNPVSILIPCHRVLGADGNLTGYAAGLSVKRALLRLEGASIPT